VLKLEGAFINVTVHCTWKLLDCLHEADIKVPIDICDSRSFTVAVDNPEQFARLLPEKWYATDQSAGGSHELEFLCDNCRLKRGYQVTSWNDKLVTFR
jgi:hypothetical protein